MESRDIDFRAFPPPNTIITDVTLESRHGIIRSIFLRLRSASANAEKELYILALSSNAISNDLYRSDDKSSFEMAKGYTKPIGSNYAQDVPTDVVNAHNQLQEKRKLALIVKSKDIYELPVGVGNKVESYIKTRIIKKDNWSTPKTLLAVHKPARTAPWKRWQKNHCCDRRHTHVAIK